MHVFGDALVGIVGVARRELQAIVGGVGQPRAEIAVGQPAPPADLQHLIEIGLIDRQQDEHGEQPRDADELPEEGGLVLVLQGGEEGVVPLIEEHADVDHPQREEHDGEQQGPTCPSVLREPVGPDHAPGVGQRPAQRRAEQILGRSGARGAQTRTRQAPATVTDGGSGRLLMVRVSIRESLPWLDAASPTERERGSRRVTERDRSSPKDVSCRRPSLETRPDGDP